MYEVYKVEEKTFEKDGETKTFKSLVLQKEGVQYPIKNVAMWDSHPLFSEIKAGDSHELEIKEVESKTPNPHGGFYKNRSVMNPIDTKETPKSDLADRVTKLEEAVFGEAN